MVVSRFAGLYISPKPPFPWLMKVFLSYIVHASVVNAKRHKSK